MTEYEMASLGTMQATMLDGVLMNFFTILTAYLVAGYAASHRLSFTVAIFLTALFSVICMYLIARYWAIGSQIIDLIALERVQFLAGKGFTWSVGVRNPPERGYVMLDIVVGVMTAAALGSIYMFFLLRRRNRAAGE